jgi:diadenosine tetraphosphate (Ap4A) HIT family hydrolase
MNLKKGGNMSNFLECEPKNIILATHRSFVVVTAFPFGEMSFSCFSKSPVNSITELSLGEKTDLWLLVSDVADRMKKNMEPAGISISVNEGLAAGRPSTERLCVHVVACSFSKNVNNCRPIPITDEEIQEIKKTLLKRGP